MQAQTEEECARLVTLLPSTESALLDWAINLMADVAQLETFNKMTARNVAMVFAPNMTQVSTSYCLINICILNVKDKYFTQLESFKTIRYISQEEQEKHFNPVL